MCVYHYTSCFSDSHRNFLRVPAITPANSSQEPSVEGAPAVVRPQRPAAPHLPFLLFAPRFVVGPFWPTLNLFQYPEVCLWKTPPKSSSLHNLLLQINIGLETS